MKKIALLFLCLALLLPFGCEAEGEKAPSTAPDSSDQAASGLEPGDLRFYRSRLEPAAQVHYDALYQAAWDFSPYSVGGGEEVCRDFQKALIALHYDFPETRMFMDLAWEGEEAAVRYFCAWEPEASFDAQAMEAILAETEALADALLAELDRQAPAREQYLEIATLLARQMDYDHGHEPASSYIYSALKDGLGICEAYADSYAYLCRRAGLWCICIDGMANGVHAWNMVEVEGKTYHVDVTWDDLGTELGWEYFLKTEAEMSRDHGRYSLYDSVQAALEAGAGRDPQYNKDILATG